MGLIDEAFRSTAIFVFISSLLFIPLEALLPARRLPGRPPLSDWVHFLVNSTLIPVVALTVMASIGGIIRASLPMAFRDWMAHLPLGLQIGIVVALAELWAYWAHRISHAVPFLWRFHRVHHSIEHMTWESALRQHPLDAIWIMGASNIPAFALGVDLRPIALFILFERCYTVLLHSNIDFSYGPLDRIISSTRFHHWHHDSGDQARNRNFAGMFSILDTLFGTYHSTVQPPRAFGPPTLAPKPYVDQVLSPIRRDQP